MKIAVVGCCGKIGTSVVKKLYYTNPALLCGAITRPGSNMIGKDIGQIIGVSNIGLPILDSANDILKIADVFIEFTSPRISLQYAQIATQHNKPIILGSTGYDQDQEDTIKELAKNNIILKATNLSLGVNILSKLVDLTAKILKDENYDVEIVDKHHASKKDSPSGTALDFGHLVAKARDTTLGKICRNTREKIAEQGRIKGTIGFHSIRGGNIIGEHTVMFINQNEIIELKHSALNRDAFIEGTIKAANWIIKQKKNGLYTFQDVINLND